MISLFAVFYVFARAIKLYRRRAMPRPAARSSKTRRWASYGGKIHVLPRVSLSTFNDIQCRYAMKRTIQTKLVYENSRTTTLFEGRQGGTCEPINATSNNINYKIKKSKDKNSRRMHAILRGNGDTDVGNCCGELMRHRKSNRRIEVRHKDGKGGGKRWRRRRKHAAAQCALALLIMILMTNYHLIKISAAAALTQQGRYIHDGHD